MENIYQHRQSVLRSLLQTSSLDLIALNPGPSLYYLTGLDFHLMERPILFLFSKKTIPIIILPLLEKSKINQLPFAVKAITYGEDPRAWRAEIQKNTAALDDTEFSRIGVEETQFRFLELEFLRSVFPNREISSCQNLIAKLRINKDEFEKAFIKQAVLMAETALTNILPLVKLGISEQELAGELVIQLIRCGSEPQLPFYPIVASGENAANPHATPTDRKIQFGDALVIDWGARHHGYISDLTRTFVIGKAAQEFEEIYRVVQQANNFGCQSVMPGIQAGDVDRIVRQVISNAGYGEYFPHRTGHGIGLEAHEEPYIRSDNTQILQAGMAFTIEPGIYIPQKWGVRIEDNIFVTNNNVELLSSITRDLVIL